MGGYPVGGQSSVEHVSDQRIEAVSDDRRLVVVEAISGPDDGIVFESIHEINREFSLLGTVSEVDVVARVLTELGSVTLTVTRSDALRVAALGDPVVTVDGHGGKVGDEVAVGQVVKVGVTELLVKSIGKTVEQPGPVPDDGPGAPDTRAISGVVEFFTEGLLHKFGFGDGDMLCDLIEEHDLEVHHQDLLIAVVERLVIPQLDQQVVTYTLATLHNPIRAATIDGEKADIDSTLTPEVVEVPVGEIIRIARTLQKADGDEDSI